MDCFTIMPFSDTCHLKNDTEIRIDAKQWTFIFNEWIKKAVESYPTHQLKCKRSTATPGNFVKGIVKDIYSSELVIADLTGQKPNVYYELGIRHSLRLGTIIITQDLKAVPSDLASYYCFGYEYTNDAHLLKEYFEKFEKELHEKITHILINKSQSDNPVADFLELKHYYQALRKKEQTDLYNDLILNLIEETKRIISIIKTTVAKKDEYLTKNQICFVFFDLLPFDSTFQRLTTNNFDEMDKQKISFAISSVRVIREDFMYVFQYWEGARNNISKGNTTTFMDILDEVLTNEEKTYTHLIELLIKD